MPSAILLLASVFAACVLANEPMGIEFHNTNPLAQYISGDFAARDALSNQLPALDLLIPPGATYMVDIPAATSPKFFISPTNNSVSVGEKRDHDTVIEATFAGSDGMTFYDVDVERGFSVPVWCHGQHQDWSTGEGCVSDVLAHCAEHLRHHDPDTGLYDQCRSDLTPANLALRKYLCPHVYVKSDDDYATKHVEGGNVLTCWILDPNDPQIGGENGTAFREKAKCQIM